MRLTNVAHDIDLSARLLKHFIGSQGDDNDDLKWILRQADRDEIVLVCRTTLDVLTLVEMPEVSLALSTYRRHSSQMWRLFQRSDGGYVVMARDRNLCLDMYLESGSYFVHLFEPHGGTNQAWRIRPSLR